MRLTERHLRSDPPTEAEVAAARADVEAAINAAADVVPLDRTATLVGLAGSVTTVTAHALALAAYEPTAIHLSTMDAAAMRAACTGRCASKRSRYNGPPAFGPVPDKPSPPKGCTPTTAPTTLRLT